MKFTAVGDFLIQQPFATPYEGFVQLKSFIEQGDVRFFNLETTLNEEGSCYASQHSGGSYLRALPKVLETAKSYGFNMTSNNNNHAFDFEMGGFMNTLECLEQSGLVHTGTGRSLPEASRPAYIKTENGTAALLSFTTSFSPSDMAGNPSEHYPGRPGVNGLRTDEEIYVTPEQMLHLKQIAEATGLNAHNDIARKEGYLPELSQDIFEFSNLRFKIAEKPGKQTVIKQDDMERVRRSLQEARENADYVVVSLHNHDIVGAKETVPPYLIDFCRFCVDNGANAVIGHGPHLMRAIEIYKGCPIFHSLGDFVLQLNSIESAPADFYEKHGVKIDAGIQELLRVRSDNGKRGLMYDRRMMETFIPFFEMENGKLVKLELLPVELGFDETEEMRGIPRPAKDFSFMERLQKLSVPFGTMMYREGNRMIVKID